MSKTPSQLVKRQLHWYCIGIQLAITTVLGCGHCNEVNIVAQPGRHEAPTRWMADKAKVLRALPFLDNVVECAWRSGVLENRAGGLAPGPSSYFLRGYAVTTTSNIARLQTDYRWHVSGDSQLDIELPNPARDIAAGARLLRSMEFEARFREVSTYHCRKVLLQPEERLIIFDLIKD